MPIAVLRFCRREDPIKGNYLEGSFGETVTSFGIVGWNGATNSSMPTKLTSTFPLRSSLASNHYWKIKSVSWAGKNCFAVRFTLPLLSECNILENHVFTNVGYSVHPVTGVETPVGSKSDTRVGYFQFYATSSCAMPAMTNDTNLPIYPEYPDRISSQTELGYFVSQHLNLDYDIGLLHIINQNITASLEVTNIALGAAAFIEEAQMVLEYF